MAYIRVNLHGSGVGEEFQFGWVLGLTESSVTEADLNAMAANLTSGWAGSTYSDDFRSWIASDQAYDSFHLYGYDTNPSAPATVVAEGSIASADGVGTATTTNLLQQAMCVSLHSDFSGASRRGRVYVPMTGVIPSPAHKFSAGLIEAVVEDVNDLLWDSTTAWASIGSHSQPIPGIWSPTRSIFSQLARLSADNRPDIQRRRAASEVASATYSASYHVP